MKITKYLLMGSILLGVSQLQGCAVAAIGAGIAAVKWANSKKQTVKNQCNEEYNHYAAIMLKNHKKLLTKKEYCSR